MKKTLAILFAALCCITANAQEINAVVTRPSDGSQNHYQLNSNPNVVLGNDNTITLKLGDVQEGQPYTLDGSNSFTVLFGSAISENESTETLEVSHPIVIENGGKLTVSGTMSNTSAQDLVIKNGGQLDFGQGTVQAMVEKNITGYSESDGYWYLVASPITGTNAPAGIGMTEGQHDLYSFDQNFSHAEWRNYKAQDFNIESQNGYLYANNIDTKLTFNGQLVADADDKELVYDETAQFAGFNLIGNPYTCNATIGRLFYRMNSTGTEIFLEDETNPIIAPCEGVFVQAQGESESVSFSKATSRGGQQREMLSMTLSQGSNTIDRAIIQFGKGETLDKFMLNESNTKLFIPQNDKDFAAVATEATIGEMPVSFKASKDGKYTISVNTANVEAEYLHLIDNLTGEDTDLLATPSYSFEAKASDYASRFKLVFGVKDNETEAAENFAYISNGEIIISNEGRATLQVIDVMGRIISNQQIEGEAHISTNGLTAGLYILNLNGMTQKIVVR